jgi:hypothetical protein
MIYADDVGYGYHLVGDAGYVQKLAYNHKLLQRATNQMLASYILRSATFSSAERPARQSSWQPGKSRENGQPMTKLPY